MTKVCKVCGLEKRLTEFPKNGKFKDGSTRYRADCKECYNISRKKLSKFLNNTAPARRMGIPSRIGKIQCCTSEEGAHFAVGNNLGVLSLPRTMWFR